MQTLRSTDVILWRYFAQTQDPEEYVIVDLFYDYNALLDIGVL